jgi:hypothetical protein
MIFLKNINFVLFIDRRPCNHQYYGTIFFNVPYTATITRVQVWRMQRPLSPIYYYLKKSNMHTTGREMN